MATSSVLYHTKCWQTNLPVVSVNVNGYETGSATFKSKDKQHPVMWGRFDDNYVLIDWD